RDRHKHDYVSLFTRLSFVSKIGTGRGATPLSFLRIPTPLSECCPAIARRPGVPGDGCVDPVLPRIDPAPWNQDTLDTDIGEKRKSADASRSPGPSLYGPVLVCS